MYSSQSRRHQPTGNPRSPRLPRSKSGTPAISLPEIYTSTLNSAKKSVHRSKSSMKSRTNAAQENWTNPLIITPSTQKKAKENRDGFVRFLQRGTQPHSTIDVAKRGRLTTTSPSAWALSPGRSSTGSQLPKSAGCGRVKMELGGGGGGGVGGVLKYFRQRKVSGIEEGEYNRFRVMHNRLLQWRFVNAGAEVAMAAVKIVAEKKLFNVWERIFKLRNSIVEKRIKIQRFKHEIKLYHIINSQLCLLKEWARLESRYSEAVERVARKLAAISICLPLVHDAKANILLVHDAMNEATSVMESIEATIIKFHSQVERTCYLLAELLIIVKQEKEYLETLEMSVVAIASLKAEEKSLRAHLIQLATESSRCERWILQK